MGSWSVLRARLLTTRGIGIVLVCIIMLLVLPNASFYPQYAEEPLTPTVKRTSHDADFNLAQLEDHTPITVNGDEQLAEMGIPGDGSQDDPYIIQNLEITSIGVSIGITNVHTHLVILNCLLYSMSSAERVPIVLSHSSNITIEDCTLRGGRYGIRLRNVSEVEIVGNRIYDAIGIDVGGNIYDGYGIYVRDSNQCRIRGNIVYANYIGIALESSEDCSIAENNVYGNDGPGLDLSGSSENNMVYENVFGWNSPSPSPQDNAVDRGLSNTWTRNSWSDYIPPGPYNVSGTAGSQDLEPSALEDRNHPYMSLPQDIIAAEGSNVQVTWITSDQFPLRYRVFVDGEMQTMRTWTQNEVSFSLSGLSMGEYDLALRFTDAAGNEAQNSVQVIILFGVFSDIGTELVIVASVFSVFSVALVVYVIKRKQ
ncbi:MAG: nitrous oxide reductase family maturation protein NosD [Candidatus Thorarchaeota archaeon]